MPDSNLNDVLFYIGIIFLFFSVVLGRSECLVVSGNTLYVNLVSKKYVVNIDDKLKQYKDNLFVRIFIFESGRIVVPKVFFRRISKYMISCFVHKQLNEQPKLKEENPAKAQEK